MSQSQSSMQPYSSSTIDFSKAVDTFGLKEQSVLVIGGASGIGQAFAEFLAEADAYVTIFDCAGERGSKIAQQLSTIGHKVQFIQGDVRSWDDQVNAFDAALSFSPYKALDIVLIVAGVSGNNIRQWLENPSQSDGKLEPPNTKCLDVNLIGPWHSTHLALHYFRQSLQHGKRSASSKQIVYVSSMEAFMNNPYLTDYTSSKWGVRGLWRSIRNTPGLLGEHGSARFRTSLIAPWLVRTPMTDSMAPVAAQVGFVYAELEECVNCLKRIICDEEVYGRAIAVAPDGKSFDLCDDWEGVDAGRELGTAMRNGRFGITWESVSKFWLFIEQSMNGGKQ